MVGIDAPAMAHNSLASSSPADGARLAKAPASVRLTFLAAVSRSSRFTITDPAGARAEGGSAKISGRTVTVPLRAGAAGVYTVAYQVPSSDGHPVKGNVRFTLTTAASPTAPPSSTAVPTAPALLPSSAAAPPVPAAAASQDGGSPWWPWALGGALLLALASGVGFVARRRRRAHSR